ncbi:MAG: YihY/virulence factor BrkB family protein [Actinobacteria bacterium]|nr:YihY/virulence factor BrkB family protein [Actinomycetota bacterium]MCB9412704.1 YihY/virulence factor BrkB family protein [Actinomycetota bacterium]
MLKRLASHPVARFLSRLVRIFIYRRVLGLSAEAAFWLVFSLPWLLLGTVSVIGYVEQWLPTAESVDVQTQALEFAAEFVNAEVMDTYVAPLIDEVFARSGAGLPLLSFLIALWSGSRSIQTFIEANMIINSQFRERGYFRIRAQSVLLLIGMAILLAIAITFFSTLPGRLSTLLRIPVWVVSAFWLTLFVLLMVTVLTGLMHITMRQRPSLLSSLPGAVVTIFGWWAGSWFLSIYLERVFSDTSVYGVLAAPIAIMLYALGLALVAFTGTAVNAALRGVDAGPHIDGAVASTVGPVAASAS